MAPAASAASIDQSLHSVLKQTSSVLSAWQDANFAKRLETNLILSPNRLATLNKM